MCSSLVPNTAARPRMMATASIARVASETALPKGLPATRPANMVPQMTGLTSDRIMTMA